MRPLIVPTCGRSVIISGELSALVTFPVLCCLMKMAPQKCHIYLKLMNLCAVGSAFCLLSRLLSPPPVRIWDVGVAAFS